MYFKKMIGKKCFLSPIDENDAEKFTEWFNDLEVTENLIFYHRILNVQNEKELLPKVAKEHNYSIIESPPKRGLIAIGEHGWSEDGPELAQEPS
jgi:hypothetical protein